MTDSERIESKTKGLSIKRGSTVLIAVDGSEYSDYAFHYYVESLHEPGNRVIVAHSMDYKVVLVPSGSSGDLVTVSPSNLTAEIDNEDRMAQDLAAKYDAKINELKLEGTVEVTRGEAGPAICALASDKNVDFIVVGSRGKGMLRRTLTGSVTDYIVHHSNIPVLVTRHKDHSKHHGIHFHNPFHREHKKSESREHKKSESDSVGKGGSKEESHKT
ncbi:stress response protein NhaX-like isoform X2 [Dreissena polymorpha]|nr:stress response protein NhaX-like isoform X2 [Dreissena polymorpha]XP_052279607.1 stress response protein NhaX-like isoform X2 [Dreissena polymorpha]